MKIIKKVLYFIEYYAKQYEIPAEDGKRFNSLIRGMRYYCKNNTLQLPNRAELEEFLYALEIPKLQQNIFRICNPEIEGVTDDIDVSGYNLSNLNDTQLLDYMALVFSTVNFVEKKNLLCLKYDVVIWTTGFHKFAQVARGKIIDLTTMEIVSYPFDKFFNINEVPETQEATITEKLKNSKYIYATDKKDGSTIVISRYKGEPLITTNGSFDNELTTLAKEILKKKYPNFLKELQSGYTYIFELIHPQNKIVIDYGSEEDLYLLSIRELQNHKLLPLDEIHEFAKHYGFPCPAIFDFKNLEHILHIARNLEDTHKEGWVVRIGENNGNECIVKIKLRKYIEMHSLFGHVRLSFVYKHLLNGTLDDVLAIANNEQQRQIQQKIIIINNIRTEIEKRAIAQGDTLLEKYDVTIENWMNNRETMIGILNDLRKEKNGFASLSTYYLKSPLMLKDNINRLKISHMKQFAELFGYDFNQ